MIKFMTILMTIALLGGPAIASDSGSRRAAKRVGMQYSVRQTGVREDDFVGVVGVLPARPMHERLIEWIVYPAAPIIRLIETQRGHPPEVVEER